jgi:hypothetical protein
MDQGADDGWFSAESRLIPNDDGHHLTVSKHVIAEELLKPANASDVSKYPLAEVRRLRQLIQIFVDENIDKKSISLLSPSHPKRHIHPRYWQHKNTAVSKAMNLLKHLRPARKLDFITLSKLLDPTRTTKFIITAALMLVDDGIVSPWHQARFFLQRHPFDDQRFMRIWNDGPHIWISENTATVCVRRFLSKVDTNDIHRSGRGCEALFCWASAVCQMVLSRNLLEKGGAVVD